MERAHDDIEKKLEDSNATPMSFPLEFLKAITCGFSTESILGQGGFGMVYKGVLRTGKVIAVKKLFEMRVKEDIFQNEVRYLMGIKHKNIVQFLGYCAESSWELIEQPSGSGKFIFGELPKRMLCFEYVSNKSLDKHISDESSGLEWNMRYEIIKGVCNGLHFLHEQCRMVHLDLKPENILMDSSMTPKIADFGLSRMFGEQQTRIVTDNRAGTCGYMAPEYLNQGLVSNKADIFSLGVMLIEIITGGRDYPYFHQDSTHHDATSVQQFTDEVLRSWTAKFTSTLKYKSRKKYTQQLKHCVTIALKCVNPSMEKRPTANDIMQVLNAVGQYDDYIEDCDMAVKRGRELADFKMISSALTRKGTALAKLAKLTKCSKDYDVAIETFQKALTEHQNPNTLKRLNDAERAKKELEQLENYDPKIADEERAKGNEFFRQQKYPEALKHYSEALWRNPKDPKIYSNRAACYTKLGAMREGLKDTEKCIELDPTFSKGYTRKGAIQFFLKEFDKAMETYHAGLKHDPSNQELFDGVMMCIQQFNMANGDKLTPELRERQYHDCIKYCDMAVERGRELADFKMISRALTRKGTVLAKYAKCSKDYDIVIKTFQKALTEHQNPDTLKILNDAERAKKELEQKEYYDPKIADREREKGNEFFRQQKYPEAVKHYTEALRRNPKDPKIYSNRAACYTKLNAMPEGLKDTEKCIELDPTFSKGYTRKSAIQFFLKDYNKAVETYHAGLKHCPSNQELLDGLERCTQHINKAYRELTPEEKAEKKTTPPIIQIIDNVAGPIYSIDANQTEPLIITGHRNGCVQIWNYDTQKVVGSTKVSTEYVTNVKFIARKRWFVAVSFDCVIHVYNDKKEMQKVTSFRAHDHSQIYCSLAVHPTQSYVLSGCDTQIKLWDWDQGWNCIQTFEEHLDAALALKFNPEDNKSFASASCDSTIKVWSLDSPKSKYTLSGHSDEANFLDFFKRHGRQYLISGSYDKTAKIWDMQTKECVHTLQHTSGLHYVVSHPSLPALVTGTDDGAVHVWSSNDFRKSLELKTLLNVSGREHVTGFACLMGSTRVAVALTTGVWVIQITDERKTTW